MGKEKGEIREMVAWVVGLDAGPGAPCGSPGQCPVFWEDRMLSHLLHLHLEESLCDISSLRSDLYTSGFKTFGHKTTPGICRVQLSTDKHVRRTLPEAKETSNQKV